MVELKALYSIWDTTLTTLRDMTDENKAASSKTFTLQMLVSL